MLLTNWLTRTVRKARSITTKQPRRKQARRFAFSGAEGLEDRQLLAADVSLLGNIVLVNGDDSADTAVVNERNGNVEITVGSGNGSETHSFRSGSVQSISFNGRGGNDTFRNNTGIASVAQGGDGSDWLIGGSGVDQLFGQSGSDWLLGNDGNDRIYGGDGADRIYGGNDNDYLHGQDGSDVIYGYFGNDLINGGNGGDVLKGEGGNDTIYGDDPFSAVGGNDRIYGGYGDDVLSGGFGTDRLYGESGDDVVYGGHGDDQLSGGTGNDQLRGSDGSDLIWGNSGNDSLYGEDGNDHLHGESGDDKVYGGADDDRLTGGSGNDRLRGSSGNDSIYGNSGNDSLFGDAGHDVLYGESGADSLRGGSGDDRLFASASQRTDRDADRLYGDSGDDFLRGIIGQDHLDGGWNNDHYETLLDFDRAGRIRGAAIAPGRGQDSETIDIDLQVGSFADDILQPFVQDVQSFIEPIKDVVDFLNEDIPVVSDVLEFMNKGRMTYLDAIQKIPGAESLGDLVDFIDAVADVPDAIQVDDGAVRLGTVEVSGTRVTSNAPEWIAELQGQGWMRSLRNVGIEFDILENPARVAEFFLGQDVNLITYELPEINISDNDITLARVEIPVPVLSFIRIVGELDGRFSFQATATIGYDTQGFRTGDWTDGFFAADTRVQVSMGLGLSAGINAVVAGAGVYGAVDGVVGISLHDPNNDGKVRIDEVGRDGWFDYDASLQYELGVYVEYWSPTWTNPFRIRTWRPGSLQVRGEVSLNDVF